RVMHRVAARRFEDDRASSREKNTDAGHRLERQTVRRRSRQRAARRRGRLFDETFFIRRIAGSCPSLDSTKPSYARVHRATIRGSLFGFVKPGGRAGGAEDRFAAA